MVDPDYAGQIRAGIGAKLNGQMTSSNSFKAFQTPMGGGFTKAQGEKFEKNRLDLMFPNAGPSSVNRNVDKAGKAFFDFSGIGTNPQGNFAVDPLTLGLTLTGLGPLSKLIGGAGKVATRLGRAEGALGKLAVVNRALKPTSVRLGEAAKAVQARAAAQLRQANSARFVAKGLREQGEDYIATGRSNTGKVIRYEPGYVRNVQRGPFDEIVSDNIESVGTASGDSYSEAMRLVRMGFAKEVLDPKTGSRTWLSVDPSGLAETGATLLRESATATADAASRAARAATRVEQGTRYTKKALELRLRNYQKLSRQPGFGVKPPKVEPTAY
jgi:hypothetical protein